MSMRHTKQLWQRPVDGQSPKSICNGTKWRLKLPIRFLLKYIARDAVDLLNAGSGGVTEVRETIEQYGEKSPLYGFVQYRRRKVLLKFVPEGTSRLLQGKTCL